MRFFTSRNSDSHVEYVIATMSNGWTVEYDNVGLLQFHQIPEDQIYPEEWLREVEWCDSPEQNKLLCELESMMMKLHFALDNYYSDDDAVLK